MGVNRLFVNVLSYRALRPTAHRHKPAFYLKSASRRQLKAAIWIVSVQASNNIRIRLANMWSVKRQHETHDPMSFSFREQVEFSSNRRRIRLPKGKTYCNTSKQSSSIPVRVRFTSRHSACRRIIVMVSSLAVTECVLAGVSAHH